MTNLVGNAVKFTPQGHVLIGVRCEPGIQRRMPFANISGTGWASEPLADALLQDAGVAALSGTAFGSYGEGYLRFSVANSMENLNEALKRIGAWVDAYL